MDTADQVCHSIILALPFEAGWSRAIASGVAAAAQSHPAWVLQQAAPGIATLASLKQTRPAGLITAITSIEEAKRCLELRRRCGVAVVNVGWLLPGVPLPHVGNDDVAIGRLAAEHLRSECGLHHLAFCGDRTTRMGKLRFAGLAEVARQTGCSLSTFPSSARRSQRSPQHESLADWLRSLPKPCGIFGASDHAAREVIDTCRIEKIAVPDQVCVVGADNDPTVCQLATPSLSSVALAMERIGFEAAGLLAQVLECRRSDQRAKVLFVQPLGVVRRRSSDVAAVGDPLVAAAMRWIRSNAHRDISVDDVAAAALTSRSVLQRRFHRVLGRTPGAELRRAHLALAKQLLADTDLKLCDVAHRAGFRRVEYLHDVFRRHVGMTMSTYRNQFRLQPPAMVGQSPGGLPSAI